MNQDNDSQMALKLFAKLNPEQQKRVYDAMVMAEASQRFRSMPQEEQERIHGELSDLFTRLKTEWEAKPENAGKTVSYRQLWDNYTSNRE